MTATALHHQALLRERLRCLARDASDARRAQNYVLASTYIMQRLHVLRLLSALARRYDEETL